MADTAYHEPPEALSPKAREIHRVIASVIEELEAIDWYHQRADATSDESVRALVLHNMNEEIEHAVMGLEWLRRNLPGFDAEMRAYLFTSTPITEVEEASTARGDEPSPEPSPQRSDLGIGSLKST